MSFNAREETAFISASHTRFEALYFPTLTLSKVHDNPSRTDSYFIVARAIQVSGARTFGQRRSALRPRRSYRTHVLRQCQTIQTNSRRRRPTAQGGGESRRNSKWSCSSTCFDSSGRGRAVRAPRLRRARTPPGPLLSLSRFTNPRTALSHSSTLHYYYCYFRSHGRKGVMLTAAVPAGSYHPTPSFFESCAADDRANRILIMWLFHSRLFF